MRTSPRTILSTVLLAILALAALPAAGHASARQTTLFEAPNELLFDQTRSSTLDEIQGFGVSNVRQIVYWQKFAPEPNAKKRPNFDASDSNAYPAGTWNQLDNLVNDATARGVHVQLTLSGPVPKWATKAKRDHVTRPSTKEFARWVKAVGSRYGDKVDTWSLWNEPNSAVFLKPRGLGAAKVYRSLYIAGAKALRSVAANKHDKILLGETAPRGGRNQSHPLAFLRKMLCLNGAYHRTSKCKKLDAQGYAHHAYTTRTGPHFQPPKDDVTIGVLGRLTTALDRAARAKAIPRHLKLYLTEFGIQTYPDHTLGVSPAVQPAYLAISEHIAYSNPRVVQFSQYLMRDDRSRGGFQTGLRTYKGKKKPSYAAFPLPLAVEKSGSRDVLWGLVRPYRHTTTVVVQSRHGGKGKWKTLRTKRTGATGVYAISTRHRKGTQYRVRWTQPAGGRLTGPPITAH
jgi:Cellulase (glycosyl hydrolase family 5)